MPKTAKSSKYKFECPMCNESWSGDDLSLISKQVANHWNKNHHDDLIHQYEKIDEKIIGGHHVHENEYIVEKIPIYITSFDVINRLGQEDGFAVVDENMSYCNNCMKFLSYDEDYEQEYCKKCKQKIHIEKVQSHNHQLNSF